MKEEKSKCEHIWTKPATRVWQCSKCEFMQNFEPEEVKEGCPDCPHDVKMDCWKCGRTSKIVKLDQKCPFCDKKEIEDFYQGADEYSAGVGKIKEWKLPKDQPMSPIVDNFLMEKQDNEEHGENCKCIDCDTFYNKFCNAELYKKPICMAGLGEECDCNQDNKEQEWKKTLKKVNGYKFASPNSQKEIKDFISNLFSLQQKKQKEEILNWIATYNGGITVGKTLEDLRSFIKNN